MKSETLEEAEARWAREAAEAKRVLKKHGIAEPQCGFAVGLGWIPIVERALDRMVEAGWHTPVIDQVKEKFGDLRIYTGMVPERFLAAVYGAIGAAEAEARATCENCGSREGVTRSGAWIKTLCWTCR